MMFEVKCSIFTNSDWIGSIYDMKNTIIFIYNIG